MVIRHLGSALRNAFASPGARLFGARFTFDYLRFALRCARHWGHTGPGNLSLLGFRLEYPNQTSALFLLHEVFVTAAYRFAARSSTPRVIDCGANIGFAVVFFKALYPGATITAFEAEPDTCARLRRNVERNALQGVEVRHAAVAGHPGWVALTVPGGDRGSIVASIRKGWVEGAAVKVPAVALSAEIRERVDFLKLDVEGAEYEVIRDLAAARCLGLVEQAVIEYHHIPDEPRGPAALLPLLEASGLAVSVTPETARSGLIRASRTR